MAIARASRGARGRVFAVVALLATTLTFVIGAQPASAAPAIDGTITAAPLRAPAGRTVTFTGTIENDGTDAMDNFTSVDIENDGSTGMTLDPITDLGAITFGMSATFTVTATITAAPGDTAQLRLKATGITAAGPDPEDNEIDSGVLPVVEFITGQVTGPASTSVAAGRTVTFSGMLTNNGTQSSDNFASVSIVDDGSTGLTISPIAPLGPVTFGQSVLFTVTATVSGALGSTAQLRLRATGDVAAGADPVDDSVDSASYTVVEAITGTLTTVAPATAPYGKNLTFEGTITNNGTSSDDTFVLVTIVDDGSTGLSFLPTITGPVAPGATVPFSVTAAVTGLPGTSAQLRLKATATAAGPDPVDDTIDSASFNVTEAVVLTVTTQRKQGTAGAYEDCSNVLPAECTVSIHDSLRYSVTVTNQSDLAMSDVKVTGPVPVGTSNVPVLPTEAIPPPPFVLLPNSAQTFIREVTVNDDATPEQLITFTAAATYDLALAPPAGPLNDRQAAGSPTAFTAKVVDPLLTITNLLDDDNNGDLVRGDIVGSTIRIENTGNRNATKTVVEVDLTNLANPNSIRIGGVPPDPAGRAVVVSPTKLTVGIGTLAPGDNPAEGGTLVPGQVVIVSFNATVVANPVGDQAASTASVGFLGGGISPKTASDQLTIMGQPDVSLVIAPTPASAVQVPRGGQITYLVTASNAAGVAAALGVQVSFPLPAQTTFVSASASSGGPPATPAVGASTGTVTVTFPTIAQNDSETLTVTVQVADGATQVNTGTPPNDIVANASTTYGPGINPTEQADPVGHELSVAELRLTSTMTDENSLSEPLAERDLLAGEVTKNTIIVANEGGSNATDTVLKVTLTNLQAPTNVRINNVVIPATQFSFSGGVLTVAVGSSPGATPEDGGTVGAPQTVTFDAAVVANPSGQPPRFARTSASVTFQNGGGSNSPQVAQIEIKNKPSLTLAIGATPAAPGPVPRNTNVSYEITATNAPGGGKATDVVITFTIPDKTTFVSLSAPGNSGTTAPAVGATGTVTATFDKVNAGNEATLTVVVKVDPGATKIAGGGSLNDPNPPNDIVASASATYGPGGNTANSTPAQIAHEISAADLTLAIDPASTKQKLKVQVVNVIVHNVGPNTATGNKTVTVDITGADAIQPPPNCEPVVPGDLTKLTCVVSDPIAKDADALIPIGVKRNTPGVVTVEASGLVTSGPEIDTLPNGAVTTTVTFLQSESDLFIGVVPGSVELIFGNPTQDVTFTVSADDVNVGENDGDPAESVTVSVTIPAQVQATNVTTSAGTCQALADNPGNSFTCTLGSIADQTDVIIIVTLKGTTLVDDPPGAGVTATVDSVNDEPSVPALNKPNTATLSVTVGPQPVNLTINNVQNQLIQTSGPNETFASGNFTVTVTNTSPTYTAETYTLTVNLPATTDNDKLTLTESDSGCTLAVNIVTCTLTNLAPGATRDVVITAEIVAAPPGPGAITVQAKVDLTTPTQEDLSPNNIDTWTVERNIPPAALDDVGPTVPAGATVVYDVLSNDSDLDVPLQTLTVTAPGVGADQKITIVTSAAGDFTVPYTVSDSRGGTDAATLKVRVVAPIVTSAGGTFKRENPPAEPPNSFGTPISGELLDPTSTPIDVLKDDLGKDANGFAFPPGVQHAVITATGPNVTGTVVTAPTTTTGGGGIVDYSPAAGYTSDPEIAPSIPAPDRIDPAEDRFSYTTTGTRTSDNRTLFTVTSSAQVRVINQNPIGVDTIFDVTNLATQDVKPAGDDLDGNKEATITVANPANGSYKFNDVGTDDPSRKLRINCIGVLTPDQLDGDLKPLVTPADVCPTDTQGVNPVEGWQKAGGAGVLLRPEGASGDVTAKLKTDSETVSLSADSAVVGEVDLHYVVTDVRGGAALAKAAVKVPNTPPQVIEGVRTVLKNTPTIVVDTKLATSDNNQDVIIVSGTSTRTEHGTSAISDDKRVITYTPDRDYLGPDKLFYNVSDQRGGAAFAELQLNVIEQPSVLGEGLGAGTPAGGSPAGNLAATGGDPLPLTAAAGACMVLGLLFVQAGRRRQSRPLLDGARHLRT